MVDSVLYQYLPVKVCYQRCMSRSRKEKKRIHDTVEALYKPV